MATKDVWRQVFNNLRFQNPRIAKIGLTSMRIDVGWSIFGKTKKVHWHWHAKWGGCPMWDTVLSHCQFLMEIARDCSDRDTAILLCRRATIWQRQFFNSLYFVFPLHIWVGRQIDNNQWNFSFSEMHIVVIGLQPIIHCWFSPQLGFWSVWTTHHLIPQCPFTCYSLVYGFVRLENGINGWIMAIYGTSQCVGWIMTIFVLLASWVNRSEAWGRSAEHSA